MNEPPVEPLENLDAQEELELTGSEHLHIYSRQACTNIHTALGTALLVRSVCGFDRRK